MRTRAKGFRSESGQVVVLFAMLLPVLFGLGAVVLDIGNWYVHKRHLQTQVDAAALAAAPGFRGCFFDPTTANLAIASAALSYAGDTARDPDARNQQVQDPGAVRVTINSQGYWAAGDSSTPTPTGYAPATDPVGDNSAGTPCATSTLDVKATDEDVPKLFSWLGIRPDIKAHAKVEIHQVEEESGFLPLAVPEIDPNYVYAIYVDYAKDGTQIPLRVQELEKGSIPGEGASFPYSGWIPKLDAVVPSNTQVTIPSNTPTGVVILVSKSDVAPSKSGTLSQICNQTPTELVQCYAGTGSTGYDGTATQQGLGFIHGFQTSGASIATPLLEDVNIGGIMSCTNGSPPLGGGPGNLSGPYYVNDDEDCWVTVTAKLDFNRAGQIYKKPAQGGICAVVTSNYGDFTWSSSSGNLSTWTLNAPMSVSVASGPNVLSITATDKPVGTGACTNSPTNTAAYGPSAMAYGTNDTSGPVAYVKLAATGANATTSCPAGTSVGDAHSTAKGNYCYSAYVGLEQPLALKDPLSPPIVLRFASKSTRKGGSGTANLNGSLLCDSGRTLTDTFTTGCFTTYALNYKQWGPTATPPCTPGAYCWKDVLCSAYPPSSLPPATYNGVPPICVAAKNGQVQAFQAGIYNRFEDPANGHGGCTPNNWPKTAAEAQQFLKDPQDGGYDFTNDPRYVTLIITDNTAFSSSNSAEPIKYFAGFYATGWDSGNGSGKPKGCYGFPIAGTCGNPNNDKHPFLGCLSGKVVSSDNGDMWGHFVKFVDFSSNAATSDALCDLSSLQSCSAVLVE